MKNEVVIVLDFGGQYNQLIARRVRECNVYCEIYSYKTDIEKIKAMNPKGIIFTGGPNSGYGGFSDLSKRNIRAGYSGFRNLLWFSAYDAPSGRKSRKGSERIWKN